MTAACLGRLPGCQAVEVLLHDMLVGAAARCTPARLCMLLLAQLTAELRQLHGAQTSACCRHAAPQQVKKYTLNLTDLELKVEDATSAETWGPHGGAMNGERWWVMKGCEGQRAMMWGCRQHAGGEHVRRQAAGCWVDRRECLLEAAGIPLAWRALICRLLCFMPALTFTAPGLLACLLCWLQRLRTRPMTPKTTARSWGCWRAACRSG